MATHSGSSTALADRADQGLASAGTKIIALGVLLMVLGALAFYNMPTATRVTVYAIGLLMLVGAVFQIAASFVVRSVSGFFAFLLSGLLYGVAGVMTVANPELGARALTLMLAASMIVSGCARIGWSVILEGVAGRGWMVVSGVVSIVTGLLFIGQWPQDTTWLLGMVLAIDLTFQGASAIGFGATLRKLSH